MSIAKRDVYATLLLNDNYLKGALVVARSLQALGTNKKIAVLVALDGVSKNTVSTLKASFDYVIGVEKITNYDLSALEIMGRPDLASTFTKITLWQQIQFRKMVYLDADVLPLRSPEELFDIEAPFAAAPELGFPDCFNSGVMVIEPSLETYKSLLSLASQGKSFDGGDQGLLNIYFDHFLKLSFGYNVELNRVYRLYMPAMNHYGANLVMIHFIGKEKPWDLKDVPPVDESAYSTLYVDFVAKWWAAYNNLVLEV